MKSAKKIKIVEAENKKPPNKTKGKEEDKEITSEKEKIYLKGETHISNVSSPGNENCMPVIEDKNGGKDLEKGQVKIYRPRENYLKEKIGKLNYDGKLLTNIQKDLGTQVQDIKTQIKSEKVLVTEVPRDLNKYILSTEENNKVIKYSNEDYENKQKHKVIKELKEEQATLVRKLKKIEENEKLLKNEGFMNLNNSSDNVTKYEKSKKEKEMKDIKTKKNDINERLKEIDARINLLLGEDNFNLTKKQKIQNFKESFERDREIIEARAKKYLRETKERNKRLASDISQREEKWKKEIAEKEKNDKLKNEQKKQKIIEKEREKEKQRLKDNEMIMLKYKPYINAINTKTKNDYLFGKYDKKFKENEERLLNKIIQEKKMKNKTVTPDELEEFWNKVEEKKEELKKMKLTRDREEAEKFELAKSYKPSYVSTFTEQAEEEYTKMVEKEKLRKEEILGLKELKKSYAEKVKQPSVNEKLKKERMDKIIALEKPQLVQIKDTLVKRKYKKIILKKRTGPSKYKWLKLEDEHIKQLNNSAVIESNLIKKPKSLREISSANRKELEQKEKEKEKENDKDKKNNKNKKKEENIDIKKIDYLKEVTEKRRKKNGGEDSNVERKKKWIKELNQNEGDLFHNMNNIKIEADNLGKKAEMEEQIAKLNGGLKNNPEAGKKISNYLIGSIEAKLTILNKMNQK